MTSLCSLLAMGLAQLFREMDFLRFKGEMVELLD